METEIRKGFTLIEGLVAIAILTLVITFVLNVIQSGFKPLEHSRAQIVSSFLAQEAIETVRSIRDTNFLEGRDWLYGLEDCIDGVCQIGVFSSPWVRACSGGTCESMGYDEGTGRYGYGDSWSESDFIREIEIDDEGSGRATISVSVRWSTGQLNMKETLYEFR